MQRSEKMGRWAGGGSGEWGEGRGGERGMIVSPAGALGSRVKRFGLERREDSPGRVEFKGTDGMKKGVEVLDRPEEALVLKGRMWW